MRRINEIFYSLQGEGYHTGIPAVCSPKEGAKINLDRIDEVKVVYVGQDVSAYLDLSASHYFLQPCSCANTEEVIAYILQHPEWRLSLQTHKLLQIP